MAANGGDNAITQIQDNMNSVYNLVVNDLQVEHNKCVGTITAINKIHEKVAVKQDDKKLTTANKQKLKGLYDTALTEALSEEQVICKTLEKIYQIYAIKSVRRHHVKSLGSKETLRRGALMKSLNVDAMTMPLWIGRPGENPPPLCGAISAESNYVAEVGQMVAALQRSAGGDENWILAEVIHYNTANSKYEVDDIDEEQKGKIILSRRRVVPLPLMRANPVTHPEALFPKNTVVMALYPQTTCFYKAVIHATPTAPMEEYEVLFEDSSYPEGYSPPLKVAQRYVIALRDRKVKGYT